MIVFLIFYNHIMQYMWAMCNVGNVMYACHENLILSRTIIKNTYRVIFWGLSIKNGENRINNDEKLRGHSIIY